MIIDIIKQSDINEAIHEACVSFAKDYSKPRK